MSGQPPPQPMQTPFGRPPPQPGFPNQQQQFQQNPQAGPQGYGGNQFMQPNQTVNNPTAPFPPQPQQPNQYGQQQFQRPPMQQMPPPPQQRPPGSIGNPASLAGSPRPMFSGPPPTAGSQRPPTPQSQVAPSPRFASPAISNQPGYQGMQTSSSPRPPSQNVPPIRPLAGPPPPIQSGVQGLPPQQPPFQGPPPVAGPPSQGPPGPSAPPTSGQRRVYPSANPDVSTPASGMPPAMPQMQPPAQPGMQPGMAPNQYPGIPPQSQPQPVMPMMNQQQMNQMQNTGGFIQPVQPPSFGGAKIQQLNNMFGAPPQQQQQMQNLTAKMGGMDVNGGASGGSHPGYLPGRNAIPVNLLQRPPNVNLFSMPGPDPWISPASSVSGSPMSNSAPEYKRCTINAIPQGTHMLVKSKIPLALVVTPYRNLLPGDAPVPVINPEQIVRCRRCRTYINPWVQFVEQGTKWKCSLCYVTNEVPSFFDWDPETRQHRDRLQRDELQHSVVEFVAPQEYMVRPPQPVVFVFIIDVSYSAIQSGMVATAARTILDTLDTIPNQENRTRVAVITVDSTLHFYNLNSNLAEPQMLVVADFDEPYLPIPDDLLVNLTECRQQLEMLLNRLGDMFKDTHVTQSAIGPALQAAYKLISPIGGKLIVLQSALPNIGEGALKSREDSKLIGTPKEATLLQPANHFYKNLAIDFSRSQMSADMFFFSPLYSDIATQSGLAKFTGGCVYHYPGFNAARPEDAEKFSTEFSHFLSRPIGLEAVLRIRAPRGIRLTAFHGNFFLRSTDLLALPNVSPDNSYVVEMQMEENIPTSLACFQTALLHTASNGERRIRVITLAVPTTNSLVDVFASADQYALATLLTKKAIERSLTTKIEDARDALVYKLVEIMGTYKQNFTTSGQAVQVLTPENLSLLPILILGMLKNLAFRPSNVASTDLRSYMLSLQYIMPPEMLMDMIHPQFFPLHNLDPQAGNPDESGFHVQLPPRLNLSSEKLERHGLYLLDNGTDIYIWVGRAISPELSMIVFDKPNYESIIAGKTTIPALSNEYSQRINNIIRYISERRLIMATMLPYIHVVKEDGDPALRKQFLLHLIEDWIEGSYSYPQWLGYLREQLSKFSSA